MRFFVGFVIGAVLSLTGVVWMASQGGSISYMPPSGVTLNPTGTPDFSSNTSPEFANRIPTGDPAVPGVTGGAGGSTLGGNVPLSGTNTPPSTIGNSFNSTPPGNSLNSSSGSALNESSGPNAGFSGYNVTTGGGCAPGVAVCAPGGRHTEIGNVLIVWPW